MDTIRVYQQQSPTLERLYGDPRGSCENLEDRIHFYPRQFDDQGRLKLEAYTLVYAADLQGEFLHEAYDNLQYSVQHMLETIAAIFNSDLHYASVGFTGYSISNGTLIEYQGTFYYYDTVGFKEISVI
jgi:hypothetical protein